MLGNRAMQTTTGKIFWAGLLTAVLVLTALTQGADAAKAKKKAPPGEVYIQQGKKIINLTPGELTFLTALSLGEDIKVGLYGISQEPAIKAEIRPLEIVVFDPETGGEKLRLSRLGYVKTSPASSFDLNTTRLDAHHFKKTYQMDYDAAIPINLWAIERDVPLQVSEVPKKPGWFRLVPRETLTPGNYAVNKGCLDGPRLYTGEHKFYPLALVTAIPPPPEVKKAPKKARKRAKPEEEVALAPQPPVELQAPPPPAAAPPAALAAGFAYQAASARSPRIRREYQITNLNDYAWHNVQIKIYARSETDGKFYLGPVTQEKDIVLPAHTVNQVPDKSFMHYETLDDAGYKLYLEISAKEGNVRKAWKNIPDGNYGESNLTEIPWDMDE